HAHYGIDTNNFIENWHSNLKCNYLCQFIVNMSIFLICVLFEEVELDYFCAHFQVGMGFNNHTLWMAERQ
ncbi:hypothetical protein BU17DRAFT_25920, partial [Hysterangium stoloniferum]